MFLILLACLIGLCFMFAGWKFYQSIDWEEPPDPSPDLRAMHKKEAELQHIQDVLEDAFRQNKISKQVVEEFQSYCVAEIQGMRTIERVWRDRREKNKTKEGGNDE